MIGMKKYKKFSNKSVMKKYASYPEGVRAKLLDLRELIFKIASKTEGVGALEESLKWNEPSFVTSKTKSGSTFRIDWKENDPDRYHILFNCRTTLISIFKELYPDAFDYDGNRRISFGLNERIPIRKLSKCIEIALTYNLNDYKNFFD